jgi:hypothetical protein
VDGLICRIGHHGTDAEIEKMRLTRLTNEILCCDQVDTGILILSILCDREIVAGVLLQRLILNNKIKTILGHSYTGDWRAAAAQFFGG